MKMMMTPKCSKCKERRIVGNGIDGTPNMIGFQLEDGTTINLCSSCLKKLGRMSDEEQDLFFKELKGE